MVNNCQRGSATVIALVAILVLGIIIGGIQPMIANNLNSNVKNRDLIEAQYAAEAGVKRAIATFQQKTPSWEWLDADVDLLDSSTPKKQYRVFIYAESDADKKHIKPDSSGNYVIVSTGTVGNTTKEVSVSVQFTQSSSGGKVSFGSTDPTSPFFYPLYSGHQIHLKGGAINKYRDDKNNIMHDKYAAKQKIHGTQGGSAKPIEGDDAEHIIMPSFEDLTSLRDSTRPVTNYSSDLTLTSSFDNKMLIVDGNVTIGQNVNLKNVTIYATGKIQFTSGGNNFDLCVFVAKDNIETSNSDVNFNTSIVVTYNNFNAHGGINTKGSIISENNMLFHSNLNSDYDPSAIDAIFKNAVSNNDGEGKEPTVNPGVWKTK